MKKLDFEKLEPRGVLKWFKTVCSVPHGLHNEAQLSKILKEALNKAGCHVKEFTSGALYATKAATKGFEKRPVVMLQAHMDMVLVKDIDLKIDLDKEPIKPYYDTTDDCIKCDGTTLGADNGVGVAAIMEIMTSDKYQHGPLEALLTVCEEGDISYCMNSIPDKMFKAKHLLNLDNDLPDRMYVSSNGTMKVTFEKKLQLKPADKKMITISIELSKLDGGHSALMIHNPGNNAIKFLCEALYSFTQDHSKIRWVSLNGGSAMNSIPAKAEFIIQVEEKDFKELQKHIKHALDNALILSQGLDKDARLVFKKLPQAKQSCDSEETEKLLLFFYFLPNGIYRMDLSMKHIFASGNLGMVRTNDGLMTVTLLPRSFAKSDLEKQFSEICYWGKIAGMTNFVKEVTCPPWLTDNPEQVKIIKTWSDCFTKVTGKYSIPQKDPGGLELSMIIQKNPQLQNHSVSVGPRIWDEHTKKERTEVKSINTFFKVLLLTLKEIK